MSKPQYLDFIPYPEFGEVLEKGTAEDKAAVLSELRLSELYNLEQIEVEDLPDITKDKLFFKLEEKIVESAKCIVVYESGNLFLILKTENDINQQFLEIEKLLKKKYGNKINDLNPRFNLELHDSEIE